VLSAFHLLGRGYFQEAIPMRRQGGGGGTTCAIEGTTYNTAFVSHTVRHEAATDAPVKTTSQVIDEHNKSLVKWWEDADLQAQFAEWGVTRVVPPAEDNVRESKMGDLKYGAVTLYAPAGSEDDVMKKMGQFLREAGVYQAYKVEADYHPPEMGQADLHEFSPPPFESDCRNVILQKVETEYHAPADLHEFSPSFNREV
jgi:hypothetical protein